MLCPRRPDRPMSRIDMSEIVYNPTGHAVVSMNVVNPFSVLICGQPEIKGLCPPHKVRSESSRAYLEEQEPGHEQVHLIAVPHDHHEVSLPRCCCFGALRGRQSMGDQCFQ